MQFPSWLKWLGIIVAIAGVAASPAYADVIPQGVASTMLVLGAIAAALTRGITAGTATTWVGILVVGLSVFADSTVAAVVGPKVAQLAGLVGAILAAVGGAVPKGNN